MAAARLFIPSRSRFGLFEAITCKTMAIVARLSQSQHLIKRVTCRGRRNQAPAYSFQVRSKIIGELDGRRESRRVP